MKYSTNMQDVEEGGNFELLPEGSYIFSIDQVEDKVTKNGDPMVSITLVVAKGDHAGRKVWDNIIFPELNSPAIRIKGRTKHFLHCINEPFEGKIEGNSDMWIGKAVSVIIFHDKYEGKTRAKVAEYILDEGSQEVVDADKIPF